jgi:HEAT repeat protein
LEDAVSRLIEGTDPALSVVAAWALGRIGGEATMTSLRKGLHSRYRSVQAHCARSLGSLGDLQVVPLLLARLSREQDTGLRLAYADALGKLRVESAIDQLLSFLRYSQDDLSRNEFSLAIARIVGGEQHYVRLQRAVSLASGNAASQLTIAARDAFEIVGLDAARVGLASALEDWAETLRGGEFSSSVASVSRIIRMLTDESVCESHARILHECADRMDEWGANRIEYVLLALHTMHEQLAQSQHRTFGFPAFAG